MGVGGTFVKFAAPQKDEKNLRELLLNTLRQVAPTESDSESLSKLESPDESDSESLSKLESPDESAKT